VCCNDALELLTDDAEKGLNGRDQTLNDLPIRLANCTRQEVINEDAALGMREQQLPLDEGLEADHLHEESREGTTCRQASCWEPGGHSEAVERHVPARRVLVQDERQESGGEGQVFRPLE
jgi:hypothetical protein